MKNKYIFLCLTSFLLVAGVSAQDTDYQPVYPEGISLEYGLGKFAVRDEYFSREKYSGPLPYFKTGWSRLHSNYAYVVGLEVQNSSDIKNYNLSTDIFQFTLRQGFLYQLPRMTLFNKDLSGYLGPSTDLFFFHNKPAISLSGIDDNWESIVGLFSLGVNTHFIYPLQRKIQLEGKLGFSVVSVGLRTVDEKDENTSEIKFLTLLNGTNGSTAFGIRYFLSKRLSVKIAYSLQMTRVSSWDPVISSGDHLKAIVNFDLSKR